MFKMDEPILLVNKKDVTESGLHLFLLAAIKNGCYKIAEHLIDKGVDINAVSTTIYQANRPLFITTQIRNTDNLRLRCSESENYKLDLMPLYISGEKAFSDIIKAIVKCTYAPPTNILSENNRNTEVLTATNDEETEAINKLISKYVENIDNNEDKLQVQELVVLERNINFKLKHPFPTFRDSSIYRPSGISNDISEFILTKYEFDYMDEVGPYIIQEIEYDYIFKNYSKLLNATYDSTLPEVLENINITHDLSIYNYWCIKLEALHSKFFITCHPKPNELFLIFNPLTSDEVKHLANCTVMENCTPLHIAADEGFEEMCKLILNKGANINPTDKNNNTPLHFAVSKGHVKIVNLLLQCAVDVNCKNVYGITALHFAAINGNEEICRALLNKGGNIDAITLNCNTPLHFAVGGGHQKIVELFLEYKANVNLEDIDGTTALHFAACIGYKDILHILLEKGGDVNALDKYHITPLHFAASNGHANILKYLLECAADITIKDIDGFRVLHFATINGKENICLELLNKGVDVNAPTSFNLKPIHFAAISNNEETFKLISGHCSDLNVKDNAGRTALHFATNENNVYAVRALLECGVNVNTQDFKGVTPLHIAVKEGFSKIVELLLSKGADINIKLSNGFTSFHLVCIYSVEWVGFFLACLSDISFKFINFLHGASYYFERVQNYFKIVELLLSSGADVNIKLKDGYTYIRHLILRSNQYCSGNERLEHEKNDSLIIMKNIIEEFVKVILNYGATIDTMILHRTMDDWLCITSLLLEYGAEINAVDEKGMTSFERSKTYYPPKLLFLQFIRINVERQTEYFYNRFAAKHLSRMVAAGKYLNEQNLTLFTTYNIHQTCMEEIKMMKNDYICSDISVHDILTKPINNLSVFANKIDLVQNFESPEYKSRYPIYANTLKRRAVLAEENKCLREYLINSGCVQVLEIFFPFTVVNEILKFFSVADLLNFRKVFQTSPNYNVYKWYLRYKKNTI